MTDRRLMRHLVVVLMSALSIAGGCTAPPTGDTSDGTWVGTITTEGDVTTVVNESGSVWGGTATLVEEMSIGSGETAREYLFGRIRALTSDGERIFVADTQAVVVRVYDFGGTHLLDIGSRGEGPGEFLEPKGIGIADDGRILIQDDRQRRIHVFASDGSYVESWPRPSQSASFDGRFTVTLDGAPYIYTTISGDPRGEDRERGMLRYGPEGRTDEAVPAPVFEDRPDSYVQLQIEERTRAVALVPFMPQGKWTMGADTTVLTGFPDSYRFELRHPDGAVTVVERLVDPVPVDRDEFEWRKQSITFSFRQMLETWSWNGPGPPQIKASYEHFFMGRNGRVWVVRELAGVRKADCDPDQEDPEERFANPCWERVLAIDIFEPEGRFLGTVGAPERFRPDVWPWIKGDTAIFVVLDELGEMVVKRYRLVLPGER